MDADFKTSIKKNNDVCLYCTEANKNVKNKKKTTHDLETLRAIGGWGRAARGLWRKKAEMSLTGQEALFPPGVHQRPAVLLGSDLRVVDHL